MEVVEAASKLEKYKDFSTFRKTLKATFDKEVTDILEEHIREHKNVDLHL